MTFILIFITVVISASCFRNPALFDKLALIPYRVVHNREGYRIWSHVFVHGDYVHLLVNMFVLLSFGGYLERLLKAYQQMGEISNSYLTYFLLYFGGTAAAAIHDLITHRDDPAYRSIGASGAVSAVIFTTIFFKPLEQTLSVRHSSHSRDRLRHSLRALLPIYGSGAAVITSTPCPPLRALFGFIFPLLMDPHSISVFWNNLTHF